MNAILSLKPRSYSIWKLVRLYQSFVEAKGMDKLNNVWRKCIGGFDEKDGLVGDHEGIVLEHFQEVGQIPLYTVTTKHGSLHEVPENRIRWIDNFEEDEIDFGKEEVIVRRTDAGAHDVPEQDTRPIKGCKLTMEQLQNPPKVDGEFHEKYLKEYFVPRMNGIAQFIAMEKLLGKDNEQVKLWRGAIDKEFKQGLLGSGVAEPTLISNVTDSTAMLSALVIFEIKFNPDGTYLKHKVRIVANGAWQDESTYGLTHAATPRREANRIFFVECVELGLMIFRLDVRQAFLQSPLDEVIYLRLPKGMRIYDEITGMEKVLRLLKSLYGLHQAARCWYDLLKRILLRYGFKQNAKEPCLYTLRDEEGNVIILINIHVDDGAYGVKSVEDKNKLLTYLRKHFEVTDEGELKEILGIQCQRMEDGSIKLHQGGYIKMKAHDFGMSPKSLPKTPLPAGFVVPREEQTEEDLDYMKTLEHSYNTMVGTIAWAAQTRIEIAYPANVLARRLKDPTRVMYRMAIRVLQYLVNTSDDGLVIRRQGIKGNTQFRITVYTDSDYASDLETRRSTTGVVGFYNRTPVYWESRLQKSVSLSSTEAEITGMKAGITTAMYLRDFAKELGHPQMRPSPLLADNKGALDVMMNDVTSHKLKHIDTQLKFAREQVGITVRPIKCPTEFNVSDMNTKALASETLNRLMSIINEIGKGQISIMDSKKDPGNNGK